MNKYSIAEAIIFLAAEYGADKMPTSEETLRRAIRTKQLMVHQEGDPGRKGYCIDEEDLRAYAVARLERSQERASKQHMKSGTMTVRESDPAYSIPNPIPFHELFSKYSDGVISPSEYYKELYNQKALWEGIMHQKQNLLAQLNAQVVALQTEIQTCQSAVDAYIDGLSKYIP